MERHVKERLIGAAVLVALAVILIPELLSGPERADEPDVVSTTEQGIKTYRFDLDAKTPVTGTQAPPPERVDSVPKVAPREDAMPPTTARENALPPVEEPVAPPAQQRASTREQVAARSQPPEPQRAPAQVAPEPRSQQPKPITTAAKLEKGWAVQIGSFQDEARANGLVQKLAGEGHRAYLVPLKRADGKVLQRVRIGPYRERAEADAALGKLGALGKGAAIVSEG